MIAVNLITGFLGVGKTTLIRHLLKEHPKDETWAVLVNEFGEVGIDGALLDEDGVAIEEVAGGCLCCVSAPAFAVGLNKLIRQYRPQRILIEPSGLGHPAQILSTLRTPLYSSIIDIQATLCVVDARHLSSQRHREHQTFVDQIHLADIVIANKADQYTAHDEDSLLEYMAGLTPAKQHIALATQGQIDITLLSHGTAERQAQFPEAHAFLLSQEAKQDAPITSDWTSFEGFTDNYYRLGFRISSEHVFDQKRLEEFLDNLSIERIKGVLKTQSGNWSINATASEKTIDVIDETEISGLQLIDSQPLDKPSIEEALKACLISA